MGRDSWPDNIMFVGMSNSGKSYWAKRLAKVTRYECVSFDDRIEALLGPVLVEGGFRGIAGVARWMGLPHEPQSAKNQEEYLSIERRVAFQLLGRLGAGETELIIDTTGSVIYLGDVILHVLRTFATVVYLETPESLVDEMFARFIKEPKPVIWGDVFKPQKGETQEESLARSYRELVRTRAQAYRKIAHVTLSYDFLRKEGLQVHDFLQAIAQSRR